MEEQEDDANNKQQETQQMQVSLTVELPRQPGRVVGVVDGDDRSSSRQEIPFHPHVPAPIRRSGTRNPFLVG